MARLPTVAIVGGTGNLGYNLVQAFLLPTFRGSFQSVIALARSESKKLSDLVSAGAEVRNYSEDDLASALEGVDVLVNAVGPAGHHFKDRLLEVLPQTSVALYFPSEFGVNHYVHDFAHPEWDAKKRHFNLTKNLIPGIRVCRIFAGLFLEDSIGPWFGFYTAESKYEAVGSLDQRTSYTSLPDVGRALAILASMPPQEVPDQVHLSGDSKSVSEVADIMEEAGAGKISRFSTELQQYRTGVLANPSPTPERYLRFLMGQGLIDHTSTGLGNDNKIFEGFNGFGKWKTMSRLAQDTKGLPWADSKWNN